jgi:hypothetical protein
MPDLKSLVQAEVIAVASGRECREALRHPCSSNFLIRLLVRPSFQNLRAFVNDLSLTGIGLLLNRALSVGDALAIQLWQEEYAPISIRLARVAHATLQADGWWLVGCRFEQPLHEGELVALLTM